MANGRIDAALARIDKALDRLEADRGALAQLEQRHIALRAAAEATVRELDALVGNGED